VLLARQLAPRRRAADRHRERTALGYGSIWLCDNVRAGSTLGVLPPVGVFTLIYANCDERSVIFAAALIGSLPPTRTG
jgi:ferredoxin-NADP reductase